MHDLDTALHNSTRLIQSRLIQNRLIQSRLILSRLIRRYVFQELLRKHGAHSRHEYFR